MEAKNCACTNVMPGFSFKPTDEELCNFLFEKLNKRPLSFCEHIIAGEVDVYSGSPWEVFQDDNPHWITISSSSDQDSLNKKKKKTMKEEDEKKTTKKTIYAFTMLNRPNGSTRAVRMAGCGTWTDQNKYPVKNDRGKVIGLKRLLMFYRQKEGGGIRKRKNSNDAHGSWNMYEYYLSETDNYVLCKINKKVVVAKEQSQISTSVEETIETRNLEHQHLFSDQQVGGNYLNYNQMQYFGYDNSHGHQEDMNLIVPEVNAHDIIAADPIDQYLDSIFKTNEKDEINLGGGDVDISEYSITPLMVHEMLLFDDQMNHHVKTDQALNIHNHQWSFNVEPASSSLDSNLQNNSNNIYNQSQYGGSCHEQANVPLLVNTKPSSEAESEAITLISDNFWECFDLDDIGISDDSAINVASDVLTFSTDQVNHHVKTDQALNIRNHQSSFNVEPAASSLDSNLQSNSDNIHSHQLSFNVEPAAISLDSNLQSNSDNIHNYQSSFNVEPAASSLDSNLQTNSDNIHNQSQCGGSCHEQSNVPVLVNNKPSSEAESEAITLIPDDIWECLDFDDIGISDDSAIDVASDAVPFITDDFFTDAPF